MTHMIDLLTADQLQHAAVELLGARQTSCTAVVAHVLLILV
jgi:hypothetical protein